MDSINKRATVATAHEAQGQQARAPGHMAEEDKPLEVLQEQLWQMRVQWQWMRQTLLRSSDVLQVEPLQRDKKTTQDSSTHNTTAVLPERVRHEEPQEKLDQPGRQNSKSERLPEGIGEDSEEQLASFRAESSNQYVALGHVKSTLLEFIEVLTEAVDYTAQVTAGEFIALRDYAEEMLNQKMDHMVGNQQEKARPNGEADRSNKISSATNECKSEKTEQQNLHNRGEAHNQMGSKNPFVLGSSTEFLPSFCSTQLSLHESEQENYKQLEEKNHELDKSERSSSSIHVNAQHTDGKALQNDILITQKRKLALVSSATISQLLHDKKRAHLESSSPSEEDCLSQKIFAEERCPCTSCVRTANGEHQLRDHDCSFRSINEICFELERSSRIMVISHREILGAVQLLRRVPPRKWMTWLESLLHFLSRSLESCSTFLALCWYTYDMLISINKCQLKRLLFLMDEYLSSQSSLCEPDLTANVMPVSSEVAETNKAVSKNSSVMSSESKMVQQNTNCISQASMTSEIVVDERTSSDAVCVEADKTANGSKQLMLLACTGRIHQNIEKDPPVLTVPNMENELKTKDVLLEALPRQSSKEVEGELHLRKSRWDCHGLFKAPFRKQGEKLQKMNFFARDALRFRQTHHLGFIFTSAINNVHKMGREMALILQFLHEDSENNSILCNANRFHANDNGLKNNSEFNECKKIQTSPCSFQKQKSSALKLILRNRKNDEILSQEKCLNQCTFRQTYRRAHHRDSHGVSASCSSRQGPFNVAKNSRRSGFPQRKSRSCSHYQKVKHRSRHHPYFPQGCFLMTESEHWNILQPDESFSPPAIYEKQCTKQANGEKISTCVRCFSKQTRNSDTSNSSTLPQSSFSESESGTPYEVESSSTTERNNSTSLFTLENGSNAQQTTSTERKIMMLMKAKESNKIITSTLETTFKRMEKNTFCSSEKESKNEESFGSSTDCSSCVQHYRCSHPCRNTEHQLRALDDSDTTEDEYPEQLTWITSETDQTMSPFCDMLYPPKSWKMLMDEGRGLIEEWQQLLPQLMEGRFLRDIREMESPQMQRVDSVILNLLACAGNCLRQLLREMETHRMLWQAEHQDEQHEPVKQGTLGNGSEMAHDTSTTDGTPQAFQTQKQLMTPICKNQAEKEESSSQNDNSTKTPAVDFAGKIIDSSIPTYDLCNKSVERNEPFSIHASTPVHNAGSNVPPFGGNSKLARDVCTYDRLPEESASLDAVFLQDSVIKSSPNFAKPCNEDINDGKSTKINETSMKNVSAEVNVGTSVTTNRTSPASKITPSAAFCTISGAEEKHGLATADALLVSHRRVFLQMLFLSKLEDKTLLCKLMKELCDGLEAALEQSKLLVSARRKHQQAGVSNLNENQSTEGKIKVTDQEQKQAQNWQKILSSLFDSYGKINNIEKDGNDCSHEKTKTKNNEDQLLKLEKQGKESDVPQTTLQTLEEKHRESMMSLEKAIMDILTFASSHPEMSHDAKETVSITRSPPKSVPSLQRSPNTVLKDEAQTTTLKPATTNDPSGHLLNLEDHNSSSQYLLPSAPREKHQENWATDNKWTKVQQTQDGVHINAHNNVRINGQSVDTSGGKKEAYVNLDMSDEVSDGQKHFKRADTCTRLANENPTANHQNVSRREVQLQLKIEGNAEEVVNEKNNCDVDNDLRFSENGIDSQYEQACPMECQEMDSEGEHPLNIEQASHLLSYYHASALTTAHLLACVLLH